MKELVFGALKFDRFSIPEHLADLISWPAVDPMALSEESRSSFKQLCEAITIFLTDPHTPVSIILETTGVTRASLYRALARCWKKHPDGRIYGFRGAIPYSRLKSYERSAAIREEMLGHGGSSGAFQRLLRNYPNIEKLLNKHARKRNEKIKSAREVRKPLREVHDLFLKACRTEGIKPNEYPFTESRLGFRTLQKYFKTMAEKEYGTAVTNAGGLKAGAAVSGKEQAPAATRAFEVVEFDGHKIDLRLTVKLKDPFGFEQCLELHRIWILVLLDVYSRSVIGYSLALGKEYNKDDVATALQSALSPFAPRSYTIPGLQIKAGGGFPSSSVPGAAYACWNWLRVDGAKSHLAVDTQIRLNQIIGCWSDNGPAGEPNERPFIERFFHLISLHFAHRLPGNLGSDPSSIERALSDPGSDISLLVEYHELEELIEVLLGNYNGEPHGGIGGRTPLEAVAYSVNRPGYLRKLPVFLRSSLCLLQEARVVTVKGSLRNGVRPHINFSNARYTNEVLASNAGLIGKKLRIYYDVRDIRVVKAFFEDGSELGILTAARPWCFTPHSLRVRQEIHRLIAEKKLLVREGENPIELWEKYKWSQAQTNKKAANDLAKAHVNVSLLPPASAPAPRVPENSLASRTLRASSEEQKENTAEPNSSDLTPAQPRVLKIRRTVTF
ncbi:Mu transposase C-terminal domain-containing protein [Massilia sp. UMI-21]|jgi:putative transposase|uniref:Mu transposase C-terminal domain-containing protein n=2 Tax=Massilia TaxID=149698 RepID=A0ABT2ARN5_9BURK|nr:Mu transposase C-terminal domain-containing protein [Massilia agri]MCS0598900.1 Mu transposase C-terminal domain-containing protein [Massilia agri]QOY92565.1 Mu transposase C-terminal domain-containing protein [Massilia sp. UMI-21]